MRDYRTPVSCEIQHFHSFSVLPDSRCLKASLLKSRIGSVFLSILCKPDVVVCGPVQKIRPWQYLLPYTPCSVEVRTIPFSMKGSRVKSACRSGPAGSVDGGSGSGTRRNLLFRAAEVGGMEEEGRYIIRTSALLI